MNQEWILNQLRLIWCKIKNIESGGTGGGIQSVQPGTNVTVDNTDPLNVGTYSYFNTTENAVSAVV